MAFSWRGTGSSYRIMFLSIHNILYKLVKGFSFHLPLSHNDIFLQLFQQKHKEHFAICSPLKLGDKGKSELVLEMSMIESMNKYVPFFLFQSHNRRAPKRGASCQRQHVPHIYMQQDKMLTISHLKGFDINTIICWAQW